MPRKTPLAPPRCLVCETPAVMTTGREIAPHRNDLANNPMWKCPSCPDSFCGCEGKTTKPLGRPADLATRDARMKLHKLMLDPIWENAAYELGYEPEDNRARAIIRNTARVRVYAYLAEKMGLPKAEC